MGKKQLLLSPTPVAHFIAVHLPHNVSGRLCLPFVNPNKMFIIFEATAADVLLLLCLLYDVWLCAWMCLLLWRVCVREGGCVFCRKQETSSHNRMPKVFVLYLMRGWLFGGNPFKMLQRLSTEGAQESVGGEEGKLFGVREMEFHSKNSLSWFFCLMFLPFAYICPTFIKGNKPNIVWCCAMITIIVNICSLFPQVWRLHTEFVTQCCHNEVDLLLIILPLEIQNSKYKYEKTTFNNENDVNVHLV